MRASTASPEGSQSSSLYRFRWVFCQLEVLRHCIPASIRQTLNQLPKSLDDTYLRVLGQIPQANQAHAHRMLQFLVVAVRPLEVKELAELLAFEFDGAPEEIPKYRPGLRVDDQTQAVLSTCSSLVTTSEVRYGKRNRRVLRYVQFSHFSVKEFLVSNRLTPLPGDISQYQIRLRPAHTSLTRVCLGLLVHSDDHIKESVKCSPLADYAARHWVEHAKFEDVRSRVKDGMETLFDPDKPHFDAWVEIYDIDQRVSSRDTWEDPNPLYYSALCGFYDLVEHLAMKHPQYVNAFGGWYKFPLLAALSQGHVNVAELLLTHRAKVDVLETTGKTMLLVALSLLRDHSNLLNIVEFLLKHGTDVNSSDNTSTSSLHLAAEYGVQPIVEMLLNHHADVNYLDINGETPLHRLLGGGTYRDCDCDHVRLLLEHGAEVNRRDKDNQTPFRLAIKSGWFRTARTLLEHGADAIVENNSGKSLWQLLLESQIYSEDEALDHALLLLKLGVEVNRLDENKEPPLHLAIRLYRFKLAGFLLKHGADANVENNQGETLWHILSQGDIKDDSRVLDFLLLSLNNGAEVNRRGRDNETPLHLAIRGRQFMIAKILLEHGADSNAESNEGVTPLQILSDSYFREKFNVLNLAQLLKHGAEVNRRDKANNTPLHLTIRGNRFILARMLLEHGADANVENYEGETPLHMLSQSSSKDEGIILNLALLLITNHGVEVNKQDKVNNTPLHLAIRRNRSRLVGILLEHGADANAENNEGMTPLQILSESDANDERNLLNIAQLLLMHGAEVNRWDKANNTPLHLAIRRSRSRLAGILFEHGANANAENNEGMTPLQILSESDADDECDILNLAKLLLKCGAEVNRCDKANNTPLHLAMQRNRFMIAETLLEHGADANVENSGGMTPLQVLSQSHIEDERILLSPALLLLKLGVELNRSNSDNETSLHLATQRNRFKLAEILLENGADTNAENDEGRTPLHILSESNANDECNVLKFAQLLLKHGAEVNKQDKANETSLHLAIQRNRFKLTDILLEHSADTNAENNEGKTPLHILSESSARDEHNILNLAQLLLKNGAELNRRDNANNTPLHLAIQRNRFMIAKTLLEHGADANVENSGGMTPLQILSENDTNDEHNMLHVLLLLLKNGVDVNRRNQCNETPLHLAICRRQFMIARILLEHGADSNAESNNGLTPLWILTAGYDKDECNILDLAQLLLKHGVEVNRRYEENYTLLHLAIGWDRFMLAKMLLEHGADADVESNKGETPLHILSQSYIKDEGTILDLALLLLTTHGVEVNKQDKVNDTPLHLAIRRNQPRLARILLENGADANAENNEGMTPLQILSESNTEDEGNVLNLAQLLKYGAEVNRRDKANDTPLHLAIRGNMSRLSGILLKHGADTNAENNESMTPLQILLERYYTNDECNILDLTSLLLDKGAEVNRRDKANDTLLHMAIRRNRFKIAETLIKRGADANAENDKGVTPLHMLSESQSPYNDEDKNLNLVLLLLKNGAEVNKRDWAKNTPLYLAIRKGQFMIAEALLKHGADTNVENEQGETPVHVLSSNYYINEGIIFKLLKNGAEVNRRTVNNDTPLHLAISHSQFVLANILLEHGADANAENTRGETPFHVFSPNYMCMDLPEDAARAYFQWRESEIGNFALLLLKNGANLTGCDKRNETPLHLAIRWGKLKLAVILLKHGAVDAENNDGKTSLRLLSESLSHDNGDFIDHARLFLEHAMRANQQDDDNKTWLLLGIGEGKYRFTELLLSLGQMQPWRTMLARSQRHNIGDKLFGNGPSVADTAPTNVVLVLRINHPYVAHTFDLQENHRMLTYVQYNLGPFQIAVLLLYYGADHNIAKNGGEAPSHQECVCEYYIQGAVGMTQCLMRVMF